MGVIECQMLLRLSETDNFVEKGASCVATCCRIRNCGAIRTNYECIL